MTIARNSQSHFHMVERFDESGVLCLSLIGELDLAVADDLAARLRQLDEQRLEVRIDLAQLEFIDSSGMRELLTALDRSRRDGSRVTVGTETTSAVRRAVDVVGLSSYFWRGGV